MNAIANVPCTPVPTQTQRFNFIFFKFIICIESVYIYLCTIDFVKILVGGVQTRPTPLPYYLQFFKFKLRL